MPHRREDENVSTDSLHEIKADLLESVSYQKSPSGRASTKILKQHSDENPSQMQQRSPSFNNNEGETALTNVIVNSDD